MSAAAYWHSSHKRQYRGRSGLPSPRSRGTSSRDCERQPSARPKAPPSHREPQANGLPLWCFCESSGRLGDPQEWRLSATPERPLSLCPWLRMFAETWTDPRLLRSVSQATRPHACPVLSCWCYRIPAVPKPWRFYLVSCSYSGLPFSSMSQAQLLRHWRILFPSWGPSSPSGHTRLPSGIYWERWTLPIRLQNEVS